MRHIILAVITGTRHYSGCHGVWNHRQLYCLFNSLLKLTITKEIKFRITDSLKWLHRWPVESPHRGPIMRREIPCTSACNMSHWVTRHRALQWRHNEHNGVSNHRRLDCLFNRLFRHRSKKTSNICVTGLCGGNSPVTGEFPWQRASSKSPHRGPTMRRQIPCKSSCNMSHWVTRHRALQWRHYERNGFSNHRRLDCLLNRLFRHRSKKTSNLCVTGLCGGNSPVTGEFPWQRASIAEYVSIWWRHNGVTYRHPSSTSVTGSGLKE